MAALKASELKYGIPLRFVLGGLWFTVTQVEIPEGKEYEVGTLELNLAKLGLTNKAIAGTTRAAYGVKGAGTTAATTAPPAAVWCNPVAAEAKTQNEAAVEVTTGALAQVTMVKQKPILRLYGITTAGDGKPVNEWKTATKATAGKPLVVTVFAVGK